MSWARKRSCAGCSSASASSSAINRRCPPSAQLGVDPLLDGGEPELLEPRDRRRSERLVCEVRERRSAPQRKPLAQQRGGALVGAVREGGSGLLREPLELAQVERVAARAHEVAGRTRLNHRARGACASRTPGAGPA